MKIQSRIKIFFSFAWVRILIISFLIMTMFLVVFLSLFLNARPKGSILVFNRDATSGTREVFIEKMLNERSDGFSPSKLNAREVSTNDAMIKNVVANKNSLGYVSFGTIAEFDEKGNPILKKNLKGKINFSTFEEIEPTKDNITSENYTPSRDFNEFFRVDKNSKEANILKYDWKNNTDPTNIVSSIDDDELKISYLFYTWTLHSVDAFNVLNDHSEISESDKELEFTKDIVDKYLNSVGTKEKENFKIEIVGSTSASVSLGILCNEFKSVMKDFGYNIVFTKSNFGSSDAFKRNIPGTNKPYLGLQSRSATDNELKNWGWDTEKDNSSYNSFAKDAILLIYNSKNISDTTRLNTTSEFLDNAYSNETYLYYKDIFTNYQEDGEVNA